LRPIHQKFIDLAKSFNIPVMIHTCGSSSWVYNDFIEMGVSAVQTLQPEAKNMNPQYLKSKFGDKLAFHGAISTTGALSFGTPDDVRTECYKTLEIMNQNGGYIFAPAHCIQDNSPVENVLAMYACPLTL
jgi:uroporphyrinogen-III decarboxylase